MANKKFLEEYSLYKKFKSDLKYLHNVKSGIAQKNIPKPAIHMYCAVCQSDQTFNMVNEYYEDTFSSQNDIINGQVKKLDYICSACERGLRIFLIHFSTEKIDDKQTQIVFEKVGQIPAWSIDMDKQLERELGEHSELYRRGLICESQGYGIGAFAYYRRITETMIDHLLDSITDLLEGEEKEKYEAALIETKKTTITQEKIDLVKDLLPVSLRPDGMNPLSTLHSALSEGLHAEEDENCLDYAEEIRRVLIYLVNQVERSKTSSKLFTESMRKILDKRADKKTEDSEDNIKK